LLRSNNECLHYYFSEIKPWNPGLFAVQRDIWIQVYGIPLHIWGDDLFKLIGNKLGVFMDYDEETTSMARLDVARLKILTEKWVVIDEVVKVEVEGVVFNLWVVEERGRQRYGVVLGGEVEDEGSMVVPSEGFNEVVEVPGAGELNFDEDEQSVEELDGDVRLFSQHGDVHEINNGRSLVVQECEKGNILLTCEKSTNIPNSQKEILYVQSNYVGNEEALVTEVGKEAVLAECVQDDKKDKSGEGGVKLVAGIVDEDVASGGPPQGLKMF
jgi:hypothetical protein